MGGKISRKVRPALRSARRRRKNAIPSGIKLAQIRTKPQPARCICPCTWPTSGWIGAKDGAGISLGAIILPLNRRRPPNEARKERIQLPKPTAESAIENPSGRFRNTIGHTSIEINTCMQPMTNTVCKKSRRPTHAARSASCKPMGIELPPVRRPRMWERCLSCLVFYHISSGLHSQECALFTESAKYDTMLRKSNTSHRSDKASSP